MLDESSAGAEVGVIWDATRARLEQCNTCFEKSDTFPVHLGLDHAAYDGVRQHTGDSRPLHYI